jgi:eukaryotic-like serine/threonine-protein kinase
MNQDRWKIVNRIFHAALEVESTQRESLVAAESNGDLEVQAEVRLLLKADCEDQSFLDAPLVPNLFPTQPAQVSPGDVLCGRFHIVHEIGEGGMGRVYEALDAELAVRLAIKVIRPEISDHPEALARFRREVRLARRITHPSVCRTFDLERESRVDVHGFDQSLVFITMEFLQGETLAAKIARCGPLGIEEAQAIAKQVADALEAARGLGIVHRDMKPANIMLVPGEADGSTECRAVIMDFGLAGLDPLITAGHGSGSGSSHTARPMGTLAYMAPEQLQGVGISTATDVYAFGLILFEMVTGQCAFPSDDLLNGIAKRLSGSAPDARSLVPSLPAKWQRAIDGCLRTNPEERFKSTADAIAVLNGEKVPVRVPRWIVFASAVVLSVALVVGWLNNPSRDTKRLSKRNTVVLADFSNSTGESVFDETLKTALTVSLSQSPFLDVLPESKVSDTLKLMARPADFELSPEVAREVCERTGSKAFITGSIAKLGSQYAVGLKAVDCQSGEVLAQQQVLANGKEKVLGALGKGASIIRGKLGESLGSIQRYDVPLVDATTSSLEALRALSLGRKAYQNDTGVALRYFQDAVERDPDFAMAYHDLGRLYFTLGESERGRVNFTKAFALRSHSSERERLELMATYYENVTGELEKALDTRKQQAACFPQLSASYDGLGYVYSLLGQHESATNMFRQSIRLNPDNPDTYGLLANALLANGKGEEGRQSIDEAYARHLDGFLLHNALYGSAFLTGNALAMSGEEQWMKDRPDYENYALSLASDSDAYLGRLQGARQFSRRAIDSSLRANSNETGAIWEESAALREAAFGNPRNAKRMAADGLKLQPDNLGAMAEAALSYGLAGDNYRAESLTNALGKRFPLDTQVQLLWLPAIRAQLDLNRHNPASAIEKLQASISVEYGQLPFSTNGSCLFPTYIRGEAYLAEGNGDLAASEFQKILDHRGVVWNCWTGALANLGVARANLMRATSSKREVGAAARARSLSAYENFLKLWKDADPDIPILRQAESEYAANFLPQRRSE